MSVGTLFIVLSWQHSQGVKRSTLGAHGVIYSKSVKDNLSLCGSLMMAILSGSEFRSFIVTVKNEYL